MTGRRHRLWAGMKHFFWISTGERLALVAVALALTLVVAFVAIPFYSDKRDRAQAAQVARVERTQRQARTADFLHHFDCTYGAALKATLRETERSYAAQARIALIARREALKGGARVRARAVYRSRQQALKTRARFQRLRANVKPVGPDIPC